MNGNERPAEAPTGPWWWFRTVATWMALLATLALLVVTIVMPAVVGGERFTILTGSMTPTYPPGTLVVVDPVDTGELGVGTAITYQLESGRPEVVTHRIIAVRDSPHGRTFVTQGDANSVPDPKPVLPEQIRGEVWYSLPYLGYANNWLTGERRALTLFLVVVLLGGYAVYNLAAEIRERRRSRTEPDRGTEP